MTSHLREWNDIILLYYAILQINSSNLSPVSAYRLAYGGSQVLIDWKRPKQKKRVPPVTGMRTIG